MDHSHHSHEAPSNITLQVEGMTCAGCANTVTRAISNEGVSDPTVNYLTGEASFPQEFEGKIPGIIKAIQDAGYKVVMQKETTKEGRFSRVEKFFLFTLPFTLVLFSGHILFPHKSLVNQPFVQLALCIPVFIAGTLFFGKSAWGSVKAGAPNMDVLIMIGAISAFVYSLAGMMLHELSHEVHQYLFFETTATIISLVLLGNVIEHRSVKQTTGALRELMRLQPQYARQVIQENGREVIKETELVHIHVGDILQVNTGDKVPVDGKLLAGEATIDESMVTGESVPVERSQNGKVIGGTLVHSGNFRMLAEKVGKDTVLSKIIEMVRNAQQSKPSIQKLGDKISNIFVPVVIAIAALTFLLSFFAFGLPMARSIMNSIAVLVISCPCAMGLATPTAVMVGIGRAARNGILIKGGSSLEELAKARTIVFDKTGTLTTGRFRIRQITALSSIPVNELESILFSLEKYSSHPIAQSVVRELEKKKVPGIPLKDIREQKGAGMTGRTESGDEFSALSYRMASHLTNDNTHSIYIIKNGALTGTADLEDELKPDLKPVVAQLHSMGIRTVLLSGDTLERCQQVADAAGIQTILAEQRPDDKLEQIAQLSKNGNVAMVGDGINDAPALAKASVGISVGSATQAAIQSAQIVLLNSKELAPLLEAVQLSRATLTAIKQNLFWAFFYNVLAIPVAAVGYLSPMIGALAMALSDVVVIGNSVRLKYKKLK